MRRMGGILAGVGMAFAVAAPGAQADAAKQCGSFSFSPDTTLSASHYGVGDLTALRTSCPVARRVAGALEGRGGLTYRSHGFTCKGTAQSTEPGARKDWRCRRTVVKKVKGHKRTVRQVVTFYSLGA